MCYEMERNAKKMLQTIEQINNVVNNFIWGVPAMICIIGVGLFLSVRTRFLQIRKFPYAMKVTIGRMLKKQLQLVVLGLYSGCGYPQSLACAPSFPR